MMFDILWNGKYNDNIKVLYKASLEALHLEYQPRGFSDGT